MNYMKHVATSPPSPPLPTSLLLIINDIHLPVVLDELYEDSIPTIDFSLLTSGTPEQRSKIVNDLGKACRDSGYFVVINLGVPKSLMKVMIETCGEFFKLSKEEKQEYAGKDILDPIFYGTSINGAATQVLFWRDFIKFIVHPNFYCPTKPTGLREISMEYSKRTGEVARELMKGISVSLGLFTVCGYKPVSTMSKARRSNWLTSSLRLRPLDSSYPY